MSYSNISVIIPCYNSESTIEKCLRSVLQQSLAPYEVIVVDDGSVDRSVDLIQGSFPHVRILKKKNGGVSSARNLGIQESRGGILAFLDSDDDWLPQKLEIQSQFLRKSGLDAVFTDFRHVDQDGKPAGWQGGLLQKMAQEFQLEMKPCGNSCYEVSGELEKSLIEHTSFIHTSTLMIHRRCFQQLSFDETLHGYEDLKMWIQLGQRFQFGYIDDVLVDVEQRPVSLGHQYFRMAEAAVAMYSGLASCLDGPNESVLQAILRREERHRIEFAEELKERGDLKRGREQLVKAFRISPRLSTFLQLGKFSLPEPLFRTIKKLKSYVMRPRAPLTHETVR